MDVQTVNRPVPGQPVNLEIVVEPPFSMLTPMFGALDDQTSNNVPDDENNKFSSRSNYVPIDPSRIDPLSPDHQQRSSDPPFDGTTSSLTSLHENGRNVSSGHSLRRGIFNFQSPPTQKSSSNYQGLKPATLNIQIPGKLPFNPFNLFNMDTIKSLVQSVTENLTGNKKAYPTGFDDTVTIISEDPEKPVPRALNSQPVVLNLNNQNNNGLSNNFNNQQESPPSQSEVNANTPFVRLPVNLQSHPKQPIVQVTTTPPTSIPHQNNHQPNNQNSIVGNFNQNSNTNLIKNNNHYNKYHNNNHVPNTANVINGNANNQQFPSQIPPPPPQNPALLTEESMINKQMETLNEVLTHEMNHRDHHRVSTTVAPLAFPFLPDLSALSQLFNWGEQGARTLAVCNACRVGFGLFVSRVSF